MIALTGSLAETLVAAMLISPSGSSSPTGFSAVTPSYKHPKTCCGSSASDASVSRGVARGKTAPFASVRFQSMIERATSMVGNATGYGNISPLASNSACFRS
jgi:hypothetical protein